MLKKNNDLLENDIGALALQLFEQLMAGQESAYDQLKNKNTVERGEDKNAVEEGGIETLWLKAENNELCISDREWEIAKEIIEIEKHNLNQSNETAFFISRNKYKDKYPELNHSFIRIKTEEGFKLGVISRAKTFFNQDGVEIKEGILARGQLSLIKTIQWEDGSNDVIRITKTSENKTNNEISKKLGYYLASVDVERPNSTPWITGKGGVKKIKDKEYTIMKLLPGDELRDRLDEFKTEKQKIDVALNLSKSIMNLQRLNIVHGDLHPGNVLIDKDLNIKPIDFDFSCELAEGEDKRVTGKAKGSRKYMAPEIGVWKKKRDNNGEKIGYWDKHNGEYSFSSDIYALGVMLEKDLKLSENNNEMKYLISRMKSKDPSHRPNITEVVSTLSIIKKLNQTLPQFKAKHPITISTGQALLLLIDHYKEKSPEKVENIKVYYLDGFKSNFDKEKLAEWLKDPILEAYDVSTMPVMINDDPSRRYFETHLSIESSKTALAAASLNDLQNYYQSIKDCFEDLGGDIDRKHFKKTGERIVVRNYAEETSKDLIKGISKKEQEEIDKVLSGVFDENDYNMNKEYADIISRIKNNSNYSELEKEKALLIVKSVRLTGVLGNKIDKYSQKGLYTGSPIPGGEIYKVGIYEDKNRGRISKTTQEKVRAGHLGLMKGHMPLPSSDLAMADDLLNYMKPSDISSYQIGANWTKYAMNQLVHPFSNAISGTCLAQLRMMMNLKGDQNFAFKNKDSLENYFKAMISTMSAISGGHSLLEFTAPFLLKDIQNAFSDLPGFSDISLKSLFYDNNKKAFDQALEDTVKYNNALLLRAELNRELKFSDKINLQQLLEFKDNGYKDKFCLHHAIESGYGFEAIAYLAEKNLLDVANELNDDGESPFHIIIRKGTPSEFQSLISKVKNKSFLNDNAKSLLALAASNLKSPMFSLILNLNDDGVLNFDSSELKIILDQNEELNEKYLEQKKHKTDINSDINSFSEDVCELLNLNRSLSKKSNIHDVEEIEVRTTKLYDKLTELECEMLNLSKSFGFSNLEDELNPILRNVKELKKLKIEYIKVRAEIQKKRNEVKGCVEALNDEELNEVLPEVVNIGGVTDVFNQHVSKNKNKNVVDLLDQFSFLMPESIYQSSAEIGLMMKATRGEDPIDMVSFKPERQLLQDVAAYVTVLLKTENEDVRNEIIQRVVFDLKSQINELSGNYDEIKNDVSIRIKAILAGEEKGTSMEMKAINAARRVKFPAPYCSSVKSIEELAVLIETKRRHGEVQDDVLKKTIERYFKEHPFYEYKSSAKNDKPVVMFVSGGPASGKGSSIGNLLKKVKESGLMPENIVYLNNDSYKSLLKYDKMKIDVFSQLTHDEAKLIRDKAFKLVKEKNMHMLLDQVSISDGATKYASNNNVPIKGIVVSTKAETALERSYARGKETGRFEDTVGVISAHQSMPRNCLNYLGKSISKDVHIDFIDNNGDKNAEPKLFMNINCLQKSFEIHDQDLFREFIKKDLINLQAKKYSELYGSEPDLEKKLDAAVNSYLNDLNNMGYSQKVKKTARLI